MYSDGRQLKHITQFVVAGYGDLVAEGDAQR